MKGTYNARRERPSSEHIEPDTEYFSLLVKLTVNKIEGVRKHPLILLDQKPVRAIRRIF